MVIDGRALPLIPNGATSIDVWKMDGGIGITMSDADGTVFAGAFLPPHLALSLANFIRANIDGETT